MRENASTTFFRFVTNHAFGRQTDTILIAKPRLHSMQRGKNEAIMGFFSYN